jgi:Trp operon repressor
MVAGRIETDAVKTKIYCVETKTLLKVCESRREASKYTGVPVTSITRHVQQKSRNSNNRLKKVICFR